MRKNQKVPSLVVATLLQNNINQIGSFPQVGVNIKTCLKPPATSGSLTLLFFPITPQ